MLGIMKKNAQGFFLGEEPVPFSLVSLPPGVYLIRITNKQGNLLHLKKIMKRWSLD